MSRPIIEVRNLSKAYLLGAIGATSLREEMERIWNSLSGKSTPRKIEEFWALRDVSFSVQPGEVLGIIGRNGAGKSTLLKILSRITQQTSGEITLRGRVASLLEVGTGFHPDLTGRENIFLNGAILGMTKAEVRSKLDEIIAFAEVEKFIDTPVKRYSSGMYVRLAFAVAAHLEQEILIVDEVLAVGDAEFQKKCLGKMKDVASGGRTVLFVTHNVAVIPRLCSSCLLMQNGQLLSVGTPAKIIGEYLQGASSGTLWRRDAQAAPQEFFFESVRISAEDGETQENFAANSPVYVELTYRVNRNGLMTRVAIEVEQDGGEIVFVSTDCDVTRDGEDLARLSGSVTVRCQIPPNLLAPGSYRVTAAASWTNHVEYDRVGQCVNFNISAIGSRAVLDKRPGMVAPVLEWSELAAEPAVAFR